MYLPLEYVKRYSVLTELYCSEEYINCEPEVLLEMIADADWGTSNYSGPNKERYIHTYNMFDNNYFAMHIISACFATAGISLGNVRVTGNCPLADVETKSALSFTPAVIASVFNAKFTG